MPSYLAFRAPDSMSFPSHSRADGRWHTFEEILQCLHQSGIYIHADQLAQFLLAHGLPVHQRYVPPHLHTKAIAIEENYRGDMVREIEELEPPCWDYSWMEDIEQPVLPNKQHQQIICIEEGEQPDWDFSWLS